MFLSLIVHCLAGYITLSLSEGDADPSLNLVFAPSSINGFSLSALAFHDTITTSGHLDGAGVSQHLSLVTICTLAIYSAYLLSIIMLSGDVHPNPGPLCGKLNFGHWNLNSLLARDKSKLPLIEALQATEKFDILASPSLF